MKLPVKRVAAVHDLSGFGRTSLTVVIPILSTMGIQVCPLPTAVLSTHTGGFNDYTFVDLTDNMEGVTNHWKSLNIDFDCIYTGFLGSSRQIDIMTHFIKLFKRKEQLVVIDPVLGDNGELYQSMNDEMVRKMRDFIKYADIITPNFTEAALLLDEPYRKNIDYKALREWIYRLSNERNNTLIITNITYTNNKKNTSVIAYNRDDHRFWKISCAYIPAHFPGTGDGFTSVLTGGLLNGDSLPVALDRAVQFITSAIRASYGFTYPEREGVLLERVLDNLKMPVLNSSYEVWQ